MSDRTLHSEWLSLIDVSGPFLAEPVLKEAFPQGLGGLDSAKKTMLRQAYDEWREARDLDDPLLPKIHAAWIDLVLKRGLELDEQGMADVLKPCAALPETLACTLPEHGITLRPDYAVVDAAGQPLMLVAAYDPDVSLTDAKKADGWAASPAERMVELCRATQVRLGLLTNGEHWMFVDAPVNAATTMANWYARLWGQEPLTLQAFVNLLGIRRFFVDSSEQLPALLDKSLEHQDEVTDALGEQVRRAVEVLIQALERADVDRKRELLDGIEPSELYEAGLTVMMRIVFLLSAEERGLLLMGDPRYEANYAISTLRLQLRANSDEILERRQDAWSRLLSVFRAVYGGIDHDSMRLPALGGSLFDPDRYPFLEGRARDSSWKSDPAKPLPIDNRTVLLLLEAVQLYQGRTLSYLALDVEQIGYVYEGLLERTAVRADEVTLDLAATKNADNPWVTLPELDAAVAKGGKAIEELLKERTGSAVTRVRNDLAKQVDDASAERLLAACHGDRDLRDRLKPYFHLLRTDPWGYPLVYPKGTFMVRTSSLRRESGTHYTPKLLTEAIVTATFEPLVYIGPSAGKPREDWKLKTPSELLDLKVCDPAMGSGAFLVQVCRWLSERLVEAWVEAEKQGYAISSEGDVLGTIESREPLRNDPDERLLTARRLIAERCLYGVDLNPMAVELAKLSIWLVTLAKGRPFGFLDHNLRIGDSLLGVHNLEQLRHLETKAHSADSPTLFATSLDAAVLRAIDARISLRNRPIRDIRDVEAMSGLNEEARSVLNLSISVADALTAELLSANGRTPDRVSLSIDVNNAIEGGQTVDLHNRAVRGLSTGLPDGTPPRRPFHWPLEFPEVFVRKDSGFDALVGNPPFVTGKRISTHLTEEYQNYLKRSFVRSKGAADLCVFFLRRAFDLIQADAQIGMIGTKSIAEGDSRLVGVKYLLDSGARIIWAVHELPWPGKASVTVSLLVIKKGSWSAPSLLNKEYVAVISDRLTSSSIAEASKLDANRGLCSDGIKIQGDGFVISDQERMLLLAADGRNAEVIRPYITGIDITQGVNAQPISWIINFGKRTEAEANAYSAPMQLLRERVKPYRDSLTGQIHEHDFWKFWDKREAFFERMKNAKQILACPSTAKFLILTFINPSWLPSHSVKLFAFEDFGSFALLQSSVHESWVRLQSGKLDQRLAYNLSKGFATFPFPERAANADLGEQLFSLRRDICGNRGLCLTDLYNKVHDTSNVDIDIIRLRKLIAQNDAEICALYGWHDITLDHQIRGVSYLPTTDNSRFAMSEASRLEILNRLAMLNWQRSEGQEREPDTTEVEQNEPLEEGLFAPHEATRGTGSG